MSGIFSRIFSLFNHKEPHEDLRHLYSQLAELGRGLRTELSDLRDRQKELVKVLSGRSAQSPTHRLGLSKTAALERQLVPKLRSLAEHAEERFIRTLEDRRSAGTVSEEERFELRKVIEFLEDVRSSLRLPEDHQDLHDELVSVETRLRTISALCEEFYQAQQAADAMKRQSRQAALSGIAKRVFESAHPETFSTPSGGQNTLLVAKISQNELVRLFEESKKVNAAGDPRTSVSWRSGWVDSPRAEMDATTGLTDRHVNVTIKEHGEKKKIHLVITS